MIRSYCIVFFSLFTLSAATAAETGAVTKGDFRIDAELAGLLVPDNHSEVHLAPEQWKDWAVKSVVAHGVMVRKGDALILFDTRAIDVAIADAQTAVAAKQAVLQRARLNLELLAAVQPITQGDAQLKQKQAADLFAEYQKDGEEYREKGFAFKVESAENSLAYAKEELKQLKKMYAKDDLVEETEEIILRRHRDAVARAEFAVEAAERVLAREKRAGLTDAGTAYKQAADRAAHELTTVINTASVTTQEHKNAVTTATADLQKAKAVLERLHKDRKAMTVTSPQAGYVYYGRFHNGKWDNKIQELLVPGGKAPAFKTLMTVAATDGLKIHGHLPVKLLGDIKAGLKGHAVVNGVAGITLPIEVRAISAVPAQQDWWSADVTATIPAGRMDLVPGMTCVLKFTPVLETDVLRAPAKGVFSDAQTPDKRYVYVADGKTLRKQHVTIGRSNGAVTVIKNGLKAGDKIHLARP
jgi:hypothetical protein